MILYELISFQDNKFSLLQRNQIDNIYFLILVFFLILKYIMLVLVMSDTYFYNETRLFAKINRS